MTRKSRKILAGLATILVGSSACAIDYYQDIWWNVDQSGMGLFIGHQGSRLGIGWFHYGSDGQPTYLLLAGELVNNVVRGDLERSTGPQPGPNYNPAQVTRSVVGTASVTFHSQNSATLSYSYGGLSGTMNLYRMSFVDASISGVWKYAESVTVSGCSNPADNGSYDAYGWMTFSAPSGGQQTVTAYESDGPTCTTTFTATRSGTLVTANGNTSCTDGGTYTVSFTSGIIGVQSQFMMTEYTSTSSRSSCVATGKRGSIKQ